MFSLIETALKNKLDPYKYLTYVFSEAPNIDINNEGALHGCYHGMLQTKLGLR